MVGFVAWLEGSRTGLSGAFEGERELSLLYVELPVCVIGTPVIALAVLALTRAALFHRLRHGTWVALSSTAVVLTLSLLVWGSVLWLEHRLDGFPYEGAR